MIGHQRGTQPAPTHVEIGSRKGEGRHAPTGVCSNTLLLISAANQALLLYSAILLCQPRRHAPPRWVEGQVRQGQVKNIKQAVLWGPSFLQNHTPRMSKVIRLA